MADTGPPRAGETILLPPGSAVLLDKLGAVAIHVEPEGEVALLVELGGRLNKTDVSGTTAFLMRVGQAAELIANIVVAVHAGDPDAQSFGDQIKAAVKAEQERLSAVEGEHGP